jgi:hypothetical protein
MRFNSFSVLLAIFPGYYTGRALHVHVKVFPDWEVLPNNSFHGGSLAHVGQFFFDDHLEAVIDEVRLLHNFPVDHLQLGCLRDVLRQLWRFSTPDSTRLVKDSMFPRLPILSSPFLYLSPFFKNSYDLSYRHFRCGHTEITPSATP